MPRISQPVDVNNPGGAVTELCPGTQYRLVIGCENANSTAIITTIRQPIGSGVTISAPNQISAGDFEFTIEVDITGDYEFRYCCKYDA